MQQSTTRHTLLSELEWRVMPALVLDQAKLYLRDDAPVAYVSWARLSEAAAARYQQDPHHLASGDWKSGGKTGSSICARHLVAAATSFLSYATRYSKVSRCTSFRWPPTAS